MLNMHMHDYRGRARARPWRIPRKGPKEADAVRCRIDVRHAATRFIGPRATNGLAVTVDGALS